MLSNEQIARAEAVSIADIAAIKAPDGANLSRDIEQLVEQQSDREWRDEIETVASRVARS